MVTCPANNECVKNNICTPIINISTCKDTNLGGICRSEPPFARDTANPTDYTCHTNMCATSLNPELVTKKIGETECRSPTNFTCTNLSMVGSKNLCQDTNTGSCVVLNSTQCRAKTGKYTCENTDKTKQCKDSSNFCASLTAGIKAVEPTGECAAKASSALPEFDISTMSVIGLAAAATIFTIL